MVSDKADVAISAIAQSEAIAQHTLVRGVVAVRGKYES